MLHPDFAYTADVHAAYGRDGYCIFRQFLTDDALVACQREIDRMIGQVQPGRAVEDIIGAHQHERWLLDLAAQPALLDLIEMQVGPNVVLWSTHLLCKPPGTGIRIPWHQDAPYWNVSGRLAAGVWIVFDDTDEANGTMEVLPGWHARGQLPILEGDDKLFNQSIDPAALPPDAEQRKVTYRLKAGQAAIHHTMIPHASYPNTSQRWRRVLVLRFIAADAVVGPKTYADYRTGEPFERVCYLLRGADTAGRGLKRHMPA